MIQRNYRRPGPALFVVVSLMANASFAVTTWYVDPDTTIPLTQKVCSIDETTPCGTDAECIELGSCILLPDPTTSWCKAAISLHDVLKSAGLGDTIRVADGTYLPDPTGLANPRDATFRLPNLLLTIEGGYAGCGAVDPDERDFVAFESILNGDLLSDDDPNAPSGAGGTCCQGHAAAGCDDATCEAAVCDANPSCCSSSWSSGCRNLALSLCCDLCGDNITRCDNSWHVVTGSGSGDTVILDGFTITAGNAGGGSLADGTGGGMLNEQGSPTVRNCTFRRNYANRGGGGVLNSGDLSAQSTPQFVNCIFDGNVVTGTGPAGGVFNIDSAPTFTNCLFVGNRSENSGGAMHSGKVDNHDGSNPTLRNSTFADNSSGNTGGGLSFQGGGAVIMNCVLWGNSADFVSDTEQAQIDWFSGTVLVIDFSDVQGCKTGTNDICDASLSNIGDDPFLDDPRFVPGPIGCYYLSDTAAGEPFGSACIDSGGLQADGISLGDGTTLGDRTTQSGEMLDTGFVDLGYHYPDTAAPIDPDTGLKFLLGDQDRDGVVDLFDYDEFVACLSGPDVGEVTPCCRIFDYELDGDVDVDDFAGFQMSFFPP